MWRGAGQVGKEWLAVTLVPADPFRALRLAEVLIENGTVE